MSRNVPLSVPNFEGNEKKYVDDAIEQTWVSTGGAYINELEEKMSDFLNTESVAACQSGTSAIHMALIDCGVGPGDMVIVPTLTFIAAVNPVKYQFAEPIFMDCDDSLCLDPVKLKEFLEKECSLVDDVCICNKTQKVIKALIVVHVFGNLADMDKIMKIANEYHIMVIEDATEALGSHYIEGKYAGTIGDYGAFSFNGNKIITTGGGGCVTARDKNKVAHIKYLSTQAKDDAHFYVHNEVGYNYRMTNVQAALGVAQMEELEEFISRKNKNYDLYKELFEGYDYASLLEFRDGTYSNKWFYSLNVNIEKINGSIKDIILELQNRGIQTRAIWGLINEQLPYREAMAYDVKKAKYYSNRIINLPCSTQITEEDIKYVVEGVKNVINCMGNKRN